jgi:hypothetical protein
MTRQQVLAEVIRLTRPLVARYLAGFDDTNHTAQAQHLPNHVAWSLGHLALTMHRLAEKLDGQLLPDSDFALTQPPEGESQRFFTESVSFGSKPGPHPSMYPSFARCREIFDHAIDRTASAFEGASDTQLDQNVKWGTTEVPLWTLAARIAFHNGMHTGQIADLRRAMKMKSIFA